MTDRADVADDLDTYTGPLEALPGEPEAGFAPGHHADIRQGVRNGDFSEPPPFPDLPIDDLTNKLPGWSFVQSVGTGTIQAFWVATPSVGSGGIISFAATAANIGDEAYLEQSVHHTGNSGQSKSALASFGSEFAIVLGWTQFLRSQFLDIDGNATGSEGATTIASAIAGTISPQPAVPNTTGQIPADASDDRLRFGVTYGSGATSTGDIATFSEVYIDHGSDALYTTNGAKLWQQLDLPETAAPATPAAGHGVFRAGTDSKPHFINDGGVDYDLSGVGVYQPLDSDLTAIAGLAPANDDVLQRKAGAWSNRTIAQLLTDLAAAGTTFQPLDSDLTAIAALTTTATGRSLLAAADAAALRTILALGTVATLASDTDTLLVANSDARIATQKAVKAYVDAAVVGLLDFKGSTDASANPNYPAASKGDAYAVSVAGKVGGASGKSVDIGDVYVASADNAGGTEASVGTSWFVLEHNLTGALLAANNLSDLASAATARTNLGLGTLATLSAIGSSEITDGSVALADMANLATNKLIGRATAGTGVPEAIDLSAAGRALIDDADAAAQRTTLGLAALAVLATVGSAQIDAAAVTLAKMADLAQDQFVGRTTASTGVPQTATITAAARTVLDDTTVGAMATTMGLGTGDSPQFTGVNVGHASDTTITRAAAGDIAVEGNALYRAGGTDVPIADGGTGASTAAAAVDALGGATSTGTGGLVRKTSPVLVTPDLGTPSAGVGTNLSGTAANLTAGIALTPPHGNAFPSSPASGDYYHRDDRGILYRYDGTRWLSVNLYSEAVGRVSVSATTLGVGDIGSPFMGLYDLWLVSADLSFYVIAGTALDASNKWVVALRKQPANTAIATFTIDSGASSTGRNAGAVSIGALLGTTQFWIDSNATKTGTPGQLLAWPRVNYRLVG